MKDPETIKFSYKKDEIESVAIFCCFYGLLSKNMHGQTDVQHREVLFNDFLVNYMWGHIF
jgi:hypothetical protein